MSNEFLEFEEVYVPTPEEMEESFHYAQVKQAKSIFENGLTKDDVPAIVNALVESALESGNVLDIAESIKIMETITDGVKADKRFKGYTLEEVAKYGKTGYVSPRGVKIEVFNAGGRYSYDNCNDPVIKELEKKLKERQEFLKKIPSEGMDIITDDGEAIKVYPAAKPVSTETYKITLPK